MGVLDFLCNVIWFFLGGILLALGWAFVGLLWCITIVGIPVGLQCFKIARLALAPFGAEIVTTFSPVSLLVNVLWWIFGGIELFVLGLGCGVLCCMTIIGIPAGIQSFKFAWLALVPFGSRVL